MKGCCIPGSDEADGGAYCRERNYDEGQKEALVVMVDHLHIECQE